MTILDFIVFVFIIVVVSYFAYRSGFEEGQAAANRKHTQQLSRLRNENGILNKRTNELYGRLDEMEERLCTAEFKLKHMLNMLHGRVVVKGTMPNGAADCAVVYDRDPSDPVAYKEMLDAENKTEWMNLTSKEEKCRRKLNREEPQHICLKVATR